MVGVSVGVALCAIATHGTSSRPKISREVMAPYTVA